ncbi:MAG: DUF1016 N-terminal domain-containing protein [Deltaproteobacteria bacterium]|nr:DUF1016 N-terminal domain-containing protein [Deltaproteobacteria bacterium]
MQELPWGHNLLLLQRIKNQALRLWYAQKALRHGWSRNILEMQIDSGLHQRQALNNFPATLPPPESDLVGQAYSIQLRLSGPGRCRARPDPTDGRSRLYPDQGRSPRFERRVAHH